MKPDEIICSCFQVTAGMIQEAVNNGATTVAEVQEATNAGTACGACVDQIEQAITAFTKESGK